MYYSKLNRDNVEKILCKQLTDSGLKLNELHKLYIAIALDSIVLYELEDKKKIIKDLINILKN